MRAALVLASLVACGSPPEELSAHADLEREQAHALPSRATPPPPLRAPGDRPDVVVYGYWPYWGDPLSTVQMDQLTHLALFSVGMNADGTLNNTRRWTDHVGTAMSLAAPWGVKVHLTLTSFSDSVNDVVLPSPTLRARAITAVADLVNAAGADGVNVDFEGVNPQNRAGLVAFVEELQAVVPEVWVATPAIDWSDAYDYAALAAASDGLFLMGYGYHWGGGNPGPVGPLFGGGPWSAYSLAWSVNDYRAAGVPDDRIVLGLPLYGYDWPSTSTAVPGTATGSGSAVFYASAVATATSVGRRWDSTTRTPYAFPSATRQLWYDDAESVEDKVAWAVQEGLQGVGFWALTYDDADPDLWSRVDALTHGAGTPPTPPGPLTAPLVIDSDDAANDPGLARVEASAAWSRSTAVPGYWGASYLAGPGDTTASDPASFWFALVDTTCVDVEAWWTSGANRSTAAPFVLYDADGARLQTVTADQQTGGGQWNHLATETFPAGWNRVALSRWVTPGTYVIADAIRISPSDACAPAPACGDGTLDPGEGCDDGNTAAADGCSATCAVEPLVLDPVSPGRAGADNTLTARQAVPGADVVFLVSQRPGATPLPGCPGLTAPLDTPRLVTTVTADPTGIASLTARVPRSFAGTGWGVVAWERASCRVSPVVVTTF